MPGVLVLVVVLLLIFVVWLTNRPRREAHLDLNLDSLPKGDSPSIASSEPQYTDAAYVEDDTSPFSPEDYIFASPVKMGRLPISYPWVYQSFREAADRARVQRFGIHTLRHSYRSWLDAVGTPIAVQQKLMRHADIRTTMSYGDVVTDQESKALSKVSAMALGSSLTARNSTQ